MLEWVRRREYTEQALGYAFTRLCQVGSAEQLMMFTGIIREQLRSRTAANLDDSRREVHLTKFVIKKSASSGRYWFGIVAPNGQILAHSEQYTAKQSARDVDQIDQRQRGLSHG